jgi:hypothetical protein
VTSHSKAQRQTIAKIAATKRHNPGADVSALKAELNTLTLEERIKAYVSQAPVPTPEQCERLAALLTSHSGAQRRPEPVGDGGSDG